MIKIRELHSYIDCTGYWTEQNRREW